jgi:hypothetical protein
LCSEHPPALRAERRTIPKEGSGPALLLKLTLRLPTPAAKRQRSEQQQQQRSLLPISPGAAAGAAAGPGNPIEHQMLAQLQMAKRQLAGLPVVMPAGQHPAGACAAGAALQALPCACCL